MSVTFPVEVVVTPRFDLFYALHALATDAPSALASWKERVERTLPGDFARGARRVAPLPLYWPLLADALQSAPGALGLDEIFSALRSVPANNLRAAVLGGIFSDPRLVETLVSGKKTIAAAVSDASDARADMLGYFGLRPYVAGSAAANMIALLVSQPESYRSELLGVVEKFRQPFESDWRMLTPALEAERDRLAGRVAGGSIAELAAELRLPVAFDDHTGVMRSRSGTTVNLRQVDRAYLIPSAFNTRRWWAKYEARGRVTLYLPVWLGAEPLNAIRVGDRAPPRGRAKGKSAGPAINAEAVFRALGDTTRYAIASILARSPVSSAELARRLQVSKPTITHHVHALRAAGLVTETADGGASRLALNRETIDGLSAAAVDDLYSSTGKLALLTTRHRQTSEKKS